MSSMNRRGFTIIEVMVVAVVGALVLVTAYQTLAANQRAMTVQTAQVESGQMMRAGLEVLFSELRELSGPGEDVIDMDDDWVQVRVMRRFGLVCGVTYGAPNSLLVRKVGSWFEDGDSIFVFADNDTGLSGDDAWISGTAGTVDTTAVCGAAPAQVIPVPGMTAVMAADSVRLGAPIRSFYHVTYGIGNYGGEAFLGMTEPGQAFVPMVGPLLDFNDGLHFEYYEEDGTTTNNEDEVVRIDVTLRTRTKVYNSVGDLIGDSVTATIYARN